MHERVVHVFAIASCIATTHCTVVGLPQGTTDTSVDSASTGTEDATAATDAGEDDDGTSGSTADGGDVADATDDGAGESSTASDTADTEPAELDLAELLSVDVGGIEALRRIRDAGTALVGAPGYIKMKIEASEDSAADRHSPRGRGTG